MFLVCGLTLLVSVTFNFYTTAHLNHYQQSSSRVTTSVLDPHEQELALLLLYQACHALIDPTDCRVKPACHWCPYGGLLDDVSSGTTGKIYPCVPTHNPCYKPADIQQSAAAQAVTVAVISAEDLGPQAQKDLQNWHMPLALLSSSGKRNKMMIQSPQQQQQQDVASHNQEPRVESRQEQDAEALGSEEEDNVDDNKNKSNNGDDDFLRPRRIRNNNQPKTQTRQKKRNKTNDRGHHYVNTTQANERNIQRVKSRVAEYKAMSPEQRLAMVLHPHDKFYAARYFAPIVNEEFKLVFFHIPKVACTQWLQLFRRMQGWEDWRERVGGLPYTPAVNGLHYLADYNMSVANEMLTSPAWTRAVFVRDPKERFLSAYLDKVVNTQHIVLGSCCRKTRDCATSETTFQEFYQLTETCENEHWGLQSERVPEKVWQLVNFVGYMATLEKDAKRLLTQVGAWERYGASGWGPNGDQPMFAEPAGQSTNHATQAQERMRHYYTPEIERGIERRYRADYNNQVFNLPRRRLFPMAKKQRKRAAKEGGEV